MTIEITPNEAAWVLDKATKTCAKGIFAISQFSKDEIEASDELKKSVEKAREIVDAVSKLGQKIAEALEKELDSKE